MRAPTALVPCVDMRTTTCIRCPGENERGSAPAGLLLKVRSPSLQELQGIQKCENAYITWHEIDAYITWHEIAASALQRPFSPRRAAWEGTVNRGNRAPGAGRTSLPSALAWQSKKASLPRERLGMVKCSSQGCPRHGARQTAQRSHLHPYYYRGGKYESVATTRAGGE